MILEVITSLFLAWLVWFIIKTYLERRNGIPGPFPLPLIGNLHQLGSNPPFSLEHLSKKYGDIYQLKLPFGTFVVLNSAELVLEAVKHKGEDFAGRPTSFFYPINDLLENKNIGTVDVGPEHILRRKFFKTSLNTSFAGIDKTQIKVSAAVRKFLEKIERMDGQACEMDDLISTTIVSYTWDWLTSKECELNDDFLKSVLELNENIEYLFRGGVLYQLFPFLTYLPTKFMKTLEGTKELCDKIFDSELRDHISSYNGSVQDMTDGLIFAYQKEKSKSPKKDIGEMTAIKFLMVEQLAGGLNAIRSLLLWSIFVMASDLDLQAKLRNELDNVVSRDRLPRIEDFNSLHVLQATVCEVLRYSAVFPLAFRKTVRDTSIKGYRIPKNTKVILNFYQSTRNPQEWDDSFMFKPERFLEEQGNFIGWNGVKNYFLPFGYGHRSCLGDDFARKIVLALLTSLLHGYTLDLPEEVARFNSGSTVRNVTHSPKNYKLIAKSRL